MIPLFRPDQVRGFDQRAFDRGVASLALMERAAGHLARAVVNVGGRGYGLRVGILCGKGNNGGDGLAAARRLRSYGAHAVVCVVAGQDALSGDAAEQLRRWRAIGGRTVEEPGMALRGADVAVDCLLGTGATGAPRGPYAAAVGDLAAADVPVVACDVPSGVDADTGRVPGVAVRADVTVTLGAHKRGLWLWPARSHSGRLVLGDLDLVEPDDEAPAVALEAGDVAALVPPPYEGGDKRDTGVVVVLAGSAGMSGAATLVARGAMAAGAGLVTVATSERALVAPTVPEALTVDLPNADPEAAFERLAGHLEGADALAVGPGLGHDEAAVTLVRQLVREVGVPLVLDADGLNAFRHAGDLLARHAAPLLVLTPHVREFGRLMDHEIDWAERVRLVPEAAKAWDAVVVAKGPGTVIAAPDGRVWINPTGAAALATGGTGDVLTGMAATLVAQRPDPAAVAGAVYLHGLAGQEAATRAAARSVTALDVAAAVPFALRRLEVARA